MLLTAVVIKQDFVQRGIGFSRGVSSLVICVCDLIHHGQGFFHRQQMFFRSGLG
jgi:hypothetical protein